MKVWTGEGLIICSQDYTRFLFNFSIKLLICLGLTSRCLPSVVGMGSSLRPTLFVSCPVNGAKDDEITKKRSSKYFPHSLLWQVGFHCNVFMFRSQTRKRVLFLVVFWTNAYFIHRRIHLYNYKRHDTLFYALYNDNIEFVTQVKLGHGDCLAYFSEYSRLKMLHVCPCESLTKQVLKPM